jgi:hypothetical protein
MHVTQTLVKIMALALLALVTIHAAVSQVLLDQNAKMVKLI